MRKFPAIILFLLSASVCCGQTTYTLNKDTAGNKLGPLFILNRPNHHLLQSSSYLGILLTDIDSIHVYKDQTALSLFGGNAKYGAIEIKLRKRARLVTYGQLLKSHDISSRDINLPVFIDSTLVAYPKTIYFEHAAVKSIKIAEETGTGMRYISVRTFNPIYHPKKGEIYIRGLAANPK